jgi:hypothetical protein
MSFLEKMGSFFSKGIPTNEQICNSLESSGQILLSMAREKRGKIFDRKDLARLQLVERSLKNTMKQIEVA